MRALAPQLRASLTCLCAIWWLCAVSGCSRGSASSSGASGDALEVAELRYQGSTGNVLFPELAEDLGYLAPLKLNYLGATISGPQDVQSTITDDTDFSLAFNGVIAKMVAARAPVRAVVGVYYTDEITWNGLFVLENGPIHGARDFIGKKIAVNTLGAHSEVVVREYLARGGLSKEEIAQVTLIVIPPINAEQALRSGQVDAVHFLWLTRDVAREHGGIRSVVSDYDLFGRFGAASYVMSTRFLKEKPNAARKFVDATARAIEWTRNTPRAEVVARLEKILAARKRNESPAMLKYFRASTADTKGGLLVPRDFSIWIDWLTKDGQLKPGQIDASAVFENHFNPFATK